MALTPRNEILEVWSSSISGGAFPYQLQAMITCLQAKEKASKELELIQTAEWTPDINMGTSGGNVATYIAMSGNYTVGGINRVIQMMNSRMFSRSWAPKGLDFMPTWIFAVIEGSIYKPGYGPEKLLEAFSDSKSIQLTETWTGTYNKTQERTVLFCNKKLNDSYISGVTYDPFTFKTLPLRYMDGNFELISRVVTASASVPLLFEPVIIEEEEYVDGGVSYASPITPLQEEIFKIMKGITSPMSYEVDTNPFPFSETINGLPNLAAMRNKSLLHINYFSPYDMNASKIKSSFAEGSALTAVSDYSAVKDRYTCINLLERMISDFSTTTIKIVDSRNVDDPLDTLKNLYKVHRETHYFVEYYMRDNTWIDLNTFTPADIFNAMEDAKKQLEYLFYYVAPV
jgi:predicted acylesterase/phospholipase RssA